MTPANDNTPSFDITAGVDGYRVWVLKPSGRQGSLVETFKSLSSAARFCSAQSQPCADAQGRSPLPLNLLNTGA